MICFSNWLALLDPQGKMRSGEEPGEVEMDVCIVGAIFF